MTNLSRYKYSTFTFRWFIIMIRYFSCLIIRMTISNYKYTLINIYQFETTTQINYLFTIFIPNFVNALRIIYTRRYSIINDVTYFSTFFLFIYDQHIYQAMSLVHKCSTLSILVALFQIL